MYKFPISYANSDTKLCCDQCTGHPNCMAYTSNPTKNQIGEVDYPCIFYSEVSGEKLKGGKTSSGTSRSKDHVMKYLGCGHSHVFETCREAGEDDGLYLIEKDFFVSGEVGVEEEKKPICSATELDEITRGRWVKTPLSVCAGEPLQHYNLQFAHVVRQTGMAEACWVHDNFSKISGQCGQNGCARNPQSSVWKSHLFEPDFTYTWQPYTCRLPLYTDAILKECLQTKGYRRPQVSGDSVSRMLGTYFAERFDHFPDALFGANRFLVENFRIIHVIWHNGVNEGAKQDVKDYYNKNVGNKTEGEFRIFHRGPFFSSEHQFHITPGRAKAVQDYIEPWLQDEVGFLEADWVNISMAASFESTTKVDGMHVVGSPMKMLFNLIMHAACA
ncbi:hypothetical protein ScalyP_jg10866 [Parmales sp. scaly parma]|nr:hypothetical protein ScalyP_jg10866 [Parmales sp. scaly parma]